MLTTPDGPIVGQLVVLSHVRGYDRASAMTDASGRYSVTGLLPGTYDLDLGYIDRTGLAGWAPAGWDGESVSLGLGETRSGVDVGYEKMGSISGIVRNPDGTPAAGRWVSATSVSPLPLKDGRGSGSIRTGPDGTFALDVPPGTWKVGVGELAGSPFFGGSWVEGGPVALDHAAATVIAVDPGEAVAGIEATLQLGATVSGVLKAADGTRFEGSVNVFVVDVGGGWQRHAADVNGAGEYRADGLKPGRYTVEFASYPSDEDRCTVPEYAGGSLQSSKAEVFDLAAGESARRDAELQYGTVITGTVSTPTGPARQTRVSLHPASGGGWTWETTDDQGRYEICATSAGDHIVGFQPDGDALLPQWWRDAEGEDASTPLSVVPGTDVSGIDARLRAGATVEGVAKGDDGRGLAWVTVTAKGRTAAGTAWTSVDRTDAAGAFLLDGLRSGTYTLKFEPDGGVGYSTTWFGGGITEAGATTFEVGRENHLTGRDVRLVRGTTLSGTTVDSVTGSPLAGVVVTCNGRSANSDSRGAFTITGLSPGECEVGATLDGYSLQARPRVAIGADGNVAVDLPLTPFASIRGTLRSDDGKALQYEASPTLYRLVGGTYRYQGQVRADSSARFAFTSLYPGTYKVAFLSSNGYVNEWWPDASSLASATAIEVAAGEHRTGIDAVLAGGPVAIKSAPRVTGRFAVGSTLTATVVTETPNAQVEYRWLADGIPIEGAAGNTLLLTAAQLGKWITVDATVSAEGKVSRTLSWSDSEARVKLGTIELGQPDLTGIGLIGETLTVQVAPPPPGATLAYRWYAHGRPLDGATGASLVLTSAHVGAEIWVLVTGSGVGYVTASRSAPVTYYIDTRPVQLTPPNVAGTAKVGLPVQAGASTNTPGATLLYAWSADGRVIDGATAETFTPGLPQLGKKLSVRVTGVAAGYTTVSSTSAMTAAVLPPSLSAPEGGRVQGDLVAIAVTRSKARFAPGLPVVYIALAAPASGGADAPVAVSGGPVLLTPPDGLPGMVSAELDRLRPGRIVVLGDASAVGASLMSELAGHTAGGVTFAD
ncbi:carboxypeptidase regulatory-like domain-containing protein [Agromyces allii]|uniref:carboxypeptidase regulatory-like domain-containing protein n=1 Tax=Agromyces allii TaxID=393607 RepID=UPI0012FA0C12|nr:carboxypeptidase regulatory-like domain-containing protein [Agromyces allii]